MAEQVQVRVFISSPSDMLREREIAERAVARINGIWQRHVRLDAFRWERRHYEAIRSFQESIGEMAAFDVVLGMLWKRIGTPLPPDLYRRSDGTAYESGTVFEIESAIACSEARGTPGVYLVRKNVPVHFSAETVEEEQRQYTALLGWWNRTTRDAQGHYRRGYQEFATLDELERLVEGLLEQHLKKAALIPTGPAWDVDAKGSPYPGLVSYDSAYRDVFFGRGLAIAGALEELATAVMRDMPVIFIVGPSGSGKSSLALAGLQPQFTANRFEGIDFWRHVLLNPAKDPVLALAQRLYAVLPGLADGPQKSFEQFAALARKSPEDAASAVRWALDAVSKSEQARIGGGRLPVGRLLVVVDQLEMILDGEHRQVLALLIRALVACESTWVIFTLRSDRYADLQLDPDFVELRRRSALFDLPPPGPSEIADIIRGPAKSAQLEFEARNDVSLAKTVEAAVRDADALPLLQMTLKRLFDAREGNVLTYAAYEAMEGLEGAIAAHAEEVFGTISPAGQAGLDPLLRLLVADIGEDGRLSVRTLGRQTLVDNPDLRELVEKLTEARLLVGIDGEIRVAHEALLRQWRRAAASPALQPQVLRLRRQIEPSFEVWRRTGLTNDLLQPGTTALVAAQAVLREHAGAFPPELDAYIHRSLEAAEDRARDERLRAEAEARRARRRARIAAVAAVAFAGVAALTFYNYDKASRSISLALLTKAQQLLLAERPAQAFAVANAAAHANGLADWLRTAGISWAKSREKIRSETIALVAEGATRTPDAAWMFADGLRTVALSPDASKIAVGDQRGQVLLLERDRSNRLTALPAHRGVINKVQFSPNADWLAVASFDRTVTLTNLATAQTVEFCGHEGPVTDVAFDPQSRYIASASYDGNVFIWDAGTRQTAHKLGGHAGWVLAVAFSADGAMLASSDQAGNVLIHRVGTWEPVATIRTGRADVVGISFSPDGRRIATGSAFGPLEVWDVSTGKRIAAIEELQNRIWQVRFSPDGRLLGVAYWNGAVRFWSWNGQAYRLAGTFDASDHWVKDIAFSADSSTILTGGATGAVRLWATDKLEPMFYNLKDNSRETLVAKYSRDGSKFATGGTDRFARLYTVDEAGQFQFQCSVEHGDWVRSVAFSHDGKSLVSAGTTDGRNDNVIKLWTPEQGDGGHCRSLGTIPVGDAYVQALAHSPDGNLIGWGTRTGEMWIGRTQADPQTSRLSPADFSKLNAVDFSPDGRFLAAGGRTRDQKGKVVVWDVRSGNIEQEFPLGGEEIYSVRFAADSRLIAAGGFGNEVVVLELGKPEPVRRLEIANGTSELLFSPDGKVLVASGNGGFISMWSVTTWEKIFQLDALIGIRGVFDFHLVRGDLAFDGEAGLVRVLPKVLQQKLGNVAVEGVLQGTDVFFDRSSRTMTQRETQASASDAVAKELDGAAPGVRAAGRAVSCMASK